MLGKVNAEDLLVNMESILIVLASYRAYGYSSVKLRKRELASTYCTGFRLELACFIQVLILRCGIISPLLVELPIILFRCLLTVCLRGSN